MRNIKSLTIKTERLTNSATSARTTDQKSPSKKDNQELSLKRRSNQISTEKNEAKRLQSTLEELIAIDTNILKKEIDRYISNKIQLEAKKQQLKNEKEALTLIKRLLKENIDEIAAKKSEIDIKIHNHELYSHSFSKKLRYSTDLESFDSKLKNRADCLSFHKNVTFMFLSAHLSDLSLLSKIENHFNILFNPKTEPQVAFAQYDGIKVLLLNKFTQVKLEKQFIGYLSVLKATNLFELTLDWNVSLSGLIHRTLEGEFKQQKNSGLYQDIKSPINEIYSSEYFRLERESKRDLFERQKMLKAVDKVANVHQIIESEIIQEELHDEPMPATATVLEIKDDIHFLTESKALEQSFPETWSQVQMAAQHCRSFETIKVEADDLASDIKDLEEQVIRVNNFNKVIKYQLLVAFREYTLAMANKSFSEKLVHTTAGLNQAKEFILRTEHASYDQTLKLLIDFLNASDNLRDNSFRTHILKTIHEHPYGCMFILKLLNSGRLEPKVQGYQYIDSQLNKYSAQLSLQHAYSAAGKEDGVEGIRPSEATIERSRLALESALAQKAGVFETVFTGYTTGRMMVRDVTVKALTKAGLFVSAGVPAAATIAASAHHPHLVAASVAGAAGIGFFEFVKQSFNKLIGNPKATSEGEQLESRFDSQH